MHLFPSPSSSSSSTSSSSIDEDLPPAHDDPTPLWRREAIGAGSLRPVDLHTGRNGWAAPPGDLFHLRSPTYFSRRRKAPAGPYLLPPAGVDWLRSPHRLDHLLSLPGRRPPASLPPKAFLLAVNLQVPPSRSGEHHSAVFYFASDEALPPPPSYLHRFLRGDDDGFRNQRFKIVNRIVKGPWLVRAAVGNHAACLLGRALECRYHRGESYLEIDVDIGSSAIASAILHLALGAVTAVTIDMGFVVEAQEEEELPERLLGAVRIAQMEIGSAAYVDGRASAVPAGGVGRAKVVDHGDSFPAEEETEEESVRSG